jgi:hypothetical protein
VVLETVLMILRTVTVPVVVKRENALEAQYSMLAWPVTAQEGLAQGPGEVVTWDILGLLLT